ncbi:MAG: PIN domain-containing protein [Actinomycetota bacterium]|nr:PIN domain-containing protein [Actinomycetota bacterium]
MTLLVDAAPLVAVANRNDRSHRSVLDCLQADHGPLVVPAPVSAEVDYLLGARLGRVARTAFLADVAAGRFRVSCLEANEYDAVVDLDRRYADLDLGLADCALVVLARRLDTRRLLTFDERHFRAVTPLQGGVFTLLPADP